MVESEQEPSPPPSEGAALVRLGIKLVGGKRGEYLSEYLDNRRVRRIAERVEKLGDAIEGEGVSLDELAAAVEEDDAAAELLEAAVNASTTSRFDEKIAYLGRCLAHAVATDDRATTDLAWARIAAVRDLEVIHVRLLHQLKSTADRRANGNPQAFVRNPHTVPLGALVKSSRNPSGMPISTFHTVMAVLIRNGLVSSDVDVSVEVEVYVTEGEESAHAEPDVDTETDYRLTALGLEIFEALESAADGAPPTDS